MILDTGILVLVARGSVEFRQVIPADADISIPAVVVAEYLAGLHLSPDPATVAKRRELLEDLLAVMPVEDYTLATADHHAELLAHARRSGRPRGSHDLLIAATARATDRILLTTDAAARFDELPGVSARLVSGRSGP